MLLNYTIQKNGLNVERIFSVKIQQEIQKTLWTNCKQSKNIVAISNKLSKQNLAIRSAEFISFTHIF